MFPIGSIFLPVNVDPFKTSFGNRLICSKVGLSILIEKPCLFVCLFDLILYVHSTIFQLCGTGLPWLNQY